MTEYQFKTGTSGDKLESGDSILAGAHEGIDPGEAALAMRYVQRAGAGDVLEALGLA